MTREEAIKIIESARSVVLANGEYDEAMRMAIEALKAEPKHGRWIKWEGDVQTCSNCKHYWIPSEDQYDYHYCPNCGAQMDL